MYGCSAGKSSHLHSPVYIYTHTGGIYQSPAQPPCCSRMCTDRITGFFHSPQVRHRRNQRESHQFVPPKTGACHHSCTKSWGNGQSSSTTLKKPQPSKQTNKQTKEYAKSKQESPHPSSTYSEMFTTLKFSILDLGQEANILFWKNWAHFCTCRGSITLSPFPKCKLWKSPSYTC